MKENEKKIEATEKEKLKIKQSEKEAENEFILNYKQIYDNFFKDNKNIISQEIFIKLKDLISKDKFLENINEELMDKIVKKEKFSKNVKNFLKEELDDLNNDNLELNISCFNIIILGNTGVGKSTLLNKILKKKLAEVGHGANACTMGVPEPYESDEAKGIRIWDSRGIENGKYNLENSFKDIENTIKNSIKENDTDKFIHCIWYCIHSNRFTEDELDNLINCYDLYIDKLPIIIIFTQSDNQIKTDNTMKDVIAKLEKKNKKNGKEEKDIKILKILSEDSVTDLGTIKSFGIHNLMEETYDSAKMGIERACTHSLMEQGTKILKDKFEEKIQKLNEEIFGQQEEIKENEESFEENNEKKISSNNFLNEKKFEYNIFRNFCKKFSREITKCLLLIEENGKSIIKQETNKEINKVIETEINKIKLLLEQIYETQFEIIANKLTDILKDDYIPKLEEKYQISNLSSKHKPSDLKRQSKKDIYNDFKPLIDDIVYRKISLFLFQELAMKFSNELLNNFHDKILKNKKETKLKKIFTKKGQEISPICLIKIKNLTENYYPSDEYEERNPKKTKKGKKKIDKKNEKKVNGKKNEEEKKDNEKVKEVNKDIKKENEEKRKEEEEEEEEKEKEKEEESEESEENEESKESEEDD